MLPFDKLASARVNRKGDEKSWGKDEDGRGDLKVYNNNNYDNCTRTSKKSYITQANVFQKEGKQM
jgi:hypothetical protein